MLNPAGYTSDDLAELFEEVKSYTKTTEERTINGSTRLVWCNPSIQKLGAQKILYEKVLFIPFYNGLLV